MDDVRLGNYHRAVIAGAKDVKAPTPIVRPGVEEPEPFTLTDEQAEALRARGPQRDDEE